MELFCLFITLAILSAYYSVLSLQRPASVLYNLLTAFVFTCAQVILTELFLGLLHQLYPSFVIIVNLALAVLVAVLGWRRRGVGSAPSLADGFVRAREAAWSACDRYSIALAVLAALVYAWILTAAYFLPPRGLDDNVYHLPAIFEYAQSHEIRLLPVDMLWPFAYPQNAELLFLWPVLLTHSQRWVDGTNVPFVLLSVMTAYALLRHLEIRERDAAFAALLYALCPVVLMVAGVAYVDIIVSLFLLFSLYYAILYHERGRLQDLYVAGLAMGLMCGMKYTALFLVVPLQALIIPRLAKDRRRHVLGYLSVAFVAGGWWYIRNAVVLGDPFFPMQALASMPRSVRGTQGGGMLQNLLYNTPYWFTRYPLADVGVGRYDGGFGLVFWGMGFLSWLVVSLRSLVMLRKTRLPVLVLLVYVPLGFLLLLIMPPQWIDLNGRFSMFVVVVGLFALCEVLRMLKDERLVSIIKVVCIALCIPAVSLMSVTNRPSYRLSSAWSDAVNHTETSEFKYLADSLPVHAMLRPAWELLDLISRNKPEGMNCMIASTSDPDIYVPGPVYGSRLQNRVMNMDAVNDVRVDAYVCTYLHADKHNVPLYPGNRGEGLTIQSVMEKDGYVPVVQTDHACLMLRKDIFDKPDTQQIVRSYYRDLWPDAFVAADKIAPRLDPHIPLITSSEIGYAVRCHRAASGCADRVYPAFRNREPEVAARLRLKECYTLDRPLPGYRSLKVLHAVYGGNVVDVYLNRRASHE